MSSRPFTMLVAAVVVVALAVAACTSKAPPKLVLDGRARFPSDEGVATTITRTRIVLDGRRSYRVSPALRAFSTYTLELQPVASRVGQYVQIGTSGGTMYWLAGIGAVLPTAPPSVLYTGVAERYAKEHGRDAVVFRDGTVVMLGRTIGKPPLRKQLQMTVRPSTHAAEQIQIFS